MRWWRVRPRIDGAIAAWWAKKRDADRTMALLEALAEPQPILDGPDQTGDVLFGRRSRGGRLDRVGRAGGETTAKAEENEHQ
jgi:hypothetical protein